MNLELRPMTYTKDNGEVSDRQILVVFEPRDNYLVYDVTKLSDEHLEVLVEALAMVEEYRDNALADFELLTGVQINSLWRSFKPGGISWKE